MTNHFQGWVRGAFYTSRPLLWPALLFPFLIGGFFAGSQYSVVFWICGALLSLPYNFVLYGINDAYDVETDVHNPRKQQHVLLAGESNARVFSVRVFIVTSIGIVLSVLVSGGSRVVLGLYAALLLLGCVYSVPPVRLKERIGIDSIANGFLYFFLPFMLGFSVAGDMSELPLVQMLLLVLAVAGFHLGAGILDIEADRRAGIVTTATWLGMRRSLLLELCLLVPALFVLWRYVPFRYYLCVVAVVLMVVMYHPKPRFARYMGYIFLYGGFVVTAGIFLIQQILKV